MADVEQGFSELLEEWLRSDRAKTVGSLSDLIEEKSFALVLLLLLFPSSLPIPTGGVTHIFEIIAMFVALQMAIGRRVLWLPKRWMTKELGATTTTKAIPFIVRRVRWFERFAKPRFARLLDARPVSMVLGVAMLGFIAGSFVAPPFSGLDTLPSLGVVVVSLGLILGDALVVALGCLVGAVGIALVVFLGSAVVRLF